MHDQPTHPKSLKFDLRILALAAMILTLAAYSTPHSATPADDWTTLEPGSVLRLDAAGEDAAAPLRLDVPGAGVLTLDAIATGPDLTPTEIVLVTGAGWSPDLVTVLERSDAHLAAAVHGPGRLELRLASPDPLAPAASAKIVTRFTPATVTREVFDPEPAGAVRSERVVRSRFYRLDHLDKGDPEPVDPDPGLTAGPGGGRLLASIATWKTGASLLKGDPEPVDPDPGMRSEDSAPRSQVLFYGGVCGAAVLAGEADDHPESIACASALRPGLPATGEIANRFGDDADVFVFDLAEAAVVEVTTGGETDTFGELLDRAGRVLAADDDGGGERNFRLARTLPPGRYFVRVRGAGTGAGEGPYELSLTARGR